MTTRSVRLDDEAERALAEIRRRSGQSISSAIKLSLISFRDNVLSHQGRRPSQFFLQYDFGEGGYSTGPARESRRFVREKLAQRRARR
jgi:hypothetical protein